MPYHVTIWPKSSRQQTQGEVYAFNLTVEQLRDRFIIPHDEGQPITWGGRTLDAGDITYLRVAFSDQSVDESNIRGRFAEYDVIKTLADVTNDWVTRAPGSASPTEGPSATHSSAADQVVELCRRFDVVSRQLQRRYGNRSTLTISDEYDVQDLMHALLLTRFLDVRAESWNPSYLGGSSRVDFLLPQERLIVEVKKTRPKLLDRQIGNELAEDVTRYSDPAANRGATDLICFIYDPDRLLTNPVGLENDLALATNERLRVTGIVA